MKRVRIVTVLAALTLAPITFSTTAGASTHSSTGKESASARQYLADSASLDAVTVKFEAIATSWIGNDTVTNAQAAAAAKPVVGALGSFEHQLQSQKWPSNVKPAVNALVTSFAGLSTDLQALAHDNLAETSSWEGPLLRDDTATTDATNRVRHDLGLPALALS
jgi:hypothetical protein